VTEALAGETLGQGEYRLVARLGSGGMGVVYEAEQARLDRRVAVKVLWPHLSQEPGLVERFNREARIAARLEHPNILPVYGFGQEGDLLYLVMRLVRGGSLKDRLRGEGPRRQGWSPREALELTRQALPPLDYAHRRGVIHRDLKPDNILLEPSDDFSSGYRVFLSDFSIARLIQTDDVELGLTQTGDALGTPTYMAPEQVQDQPLDGRADLYSFGVVLYEILVGQVPFRGQTAMGVAIQHVRDPVPSPRELNPKLSPPVEAVLLRALAKDRTERFGTGAALIEALSEAVESVNGAAPRTRRPSREASPTQAPVAPPGRSTNATPVRDPAKGNRGARGGRRAWLLTLGALLVLGGLAVVGSLLVEPGVPTTEPQLASNATTLAPADPRDLAVSESELGPGWSMAAESTAGSAPDLNVYEVDYANASDSLARTAGFSLFSASTPNEAAAGQSQLREAAEARGVTFEAIDALSWLGHANPSADPSSLSIVHLFRVGRVVAVVELIGAADQEPSLRAVAERAAKLQRDRLTSAAE
jgi:serine/threonine protein kinase